MYKKVGIGICEKESKIIGNKLILILLLSLIGIILVSCGNKKLSKDELVMEYENCIEYDGNYYFSDKENIYVAKENEKAQKIAKGGYIYFVNENGIFYSNIDTNNLGSRIRKTLCVMGFDGGDSQLLLTDIWDAKYFDQGILYSSLKAGATDGGDYNWNPLKYCDLDGKNTKDILNLKSCLYFYPYSIKDIPYVFVIMDDHLSRYRFADGELDGDWLTFDTNIFGTSELNQYIYLADASNVYEVELSSFTAEVVDNKTCDTMTTCGSDIYALLFNGNENYNERKWCKLNENKEFVQIE